MLWLLLAASRLFPVGRNSTLCSRSNFSADGQRINLMESCGEERRLRTPRNDPSLNHLIRTQQQRLRNRDPERLRRQIGGLGMRISSAIRPSILRTWRP
jgi:hypothetical protein